MNTTEINKATGILSVRVYDKNDNLIEELSEQNLIVNVGKQSLAILLSAGTTTKKVTKIGFGTSGTAAASGDTALTSSFVKDLDGYTYPDSTSVLFSWSLAYSEANGKAIQEFGLISLDNSLFARRVRSVINKTVDLRLEGTWKIQF